MKDENLKEYIKVVEEFFTELEEDEYYSFLEDNNLQDNEDSLYKYSRNLYFHIEDLYDIVICADGEAYIILSSISELQELRSVYMCLMSICSLDINTYIRLLNEYKIIHHLIPIMSTFDFTYMTDLLNIEDIFSIALNNYKKEGKLV